MIWLTVYADLMTNLVLIFLALYGLTMMGDKAVRDAVLSMKIEDIKDLDEVDFLADFDELSLNLRERFNKDPNVTILEEAGSVRITLGQDLLFKSGRAVPKKAARRVAAEVAKILKPMPYTIIVEGHADSVPVGDGSPFKNNWELSLARAMSMVRLLVKEGGMPPDQFAAAAYGLGRPRATNFTSSGRQVNRRVEIALQKDMPYTRNGTQGYMPHKG